jgi:hypothetical protein
MDLHCQVRPGPFSNVARGVGAPDIGSFRAGTGAGAPAIYLTSNGCRREFRVTDGASILTSESKSASARGWETFFGRRV